MASITDRIATVLAANINALLEKPAVSDPRSDAEGRLGALEKSLAEIREYSQALFDEERRSKEALDRLVEKAARLDELARRALMTGDELKARDLVGEKVELASRERSLREAYDAAHGTAERMRAFEERVLAEIDAIKEPMRPAAEPRDVPPVSPDASEQDCPELLTLEERVKLEQLKEELARLGR